MPERYSELLSMNRLHVWLIGGVAALTLASCGKSPDSTSSGAAPASAPAAPDKAMTTSTPQPVKLKEAGFTALQGVISKTKTAAEAGNFDQAKAEFEKFEDSWKTVEDGVKAKSSETYGEIEDGMDTVNSGIKGKNKEKVLSALQTLTKSIASAVKP